MVEYTKINCKLTNIQLNKIKRAVRNDEEIVLRLNIKNFRFNELPHELYLTTRINNNLSTDIKFSKAQLKRLIQSGGFLGRLLGRLAGPLLKTGLPFLKSAIKPLGLLGLTAASSAIDAVVQKRIYGSGAVKLIIENDDMNNIMNITKALENSGILLKGVTKTIEMKLKNTEEDFCQCY